MAYSPYGQASRPTARPEPARQADPRYHDGGAPERLAEGAGFARDSGAAQGWAEGWEGAGQEADFAETKEDSQGRRQRALAQRQVLSRPPIRSLANSQEIT